MSGYAKPKQDRIYLIAKALHVDEAWLIGYDVPMVKETFTQNISPNEKTSWTYTEYWTTRVSILLIQSHKWNTKELRMVISNSGM